MVLRSRVLREMVMEMEEKAFRKLIVWKRAHSLTLGSLQSSVRAFLDMSCLD